MEPNYENMATEEEDGGACLKLKRMRAATRGE
jgi:hypothetical protein